MRIREIQFTDFRSFRGERRISFVDPLTDSVRPVTVLAGSNGSGKTTVLDAIEALLAFVLEPDTPNRLVEETFASGLIQMEVEFSLEELSGSNGQPLVMMPEDRRARTLHIVVGRRSLAPPSPERLWPNLYCRLVHRDVSGRPFVRKAVLADRLRKAVSAMHQGNTELRGGLIYFPHDRRLNATRGGAVEPPPQMRPWRFRLTEQDSWQGSLEQLWVWQNYLDLEQANSDHRNLKPFVTTLESVLGQGREIVIREGRVWVPTNWRDKSGQGALVRLDQLPSGEQQALLLFGELARRRRPGSVIAIDEVENSLHPTLQRLMMWGLRQMARDGDAQVIVATHSLEVINSVRGGAFINLDFPEDRFNLPVDANGEGS